MFSGGRERVHWNKWIKTEEWGGGRGNEYKFGKYLGSREGKLLIIEKEKPISQWTQYLNWTNVRDSHDI